MLSLKERAKQTKFKQDTIKLVGYNKDGTNIRATVAQIKNKNNHVENYAWIISDENVVFLSETMFDGVYEPCIKVPMALWMAFKLNYQNKLDEVHQKYMNHLIGHKIKKLRRTYSYNPFLDPEERPWWDKYKIIKERTAKTLHEKFLTPEEVKANPQLYDNMPTLKPLESKSKKKGRSQGRKRRKMSELFMKRYTDPLLHLDYADMEEELKSNLS